MTTDDPETRPTVTLLHGREKRLESGHPWVYSNEIAMEPATKAMPPGTLVTLLTGRGQRLGVATFNPHALIAARLLDRDGNRKIDTGFFAGRFGRALELRERLFPGESHYRLVHGEADGLPGVIVDRYGDSVVCQLNTAGMATLEEPLIAALSTVISPTNLVVRADATARALEQLPDRVSVIKGSITEPVKVRENGITYLADLGGGQKTGWFYDQRENRRQVAALSRASRVLDVYSYVGGFGLLAAAAGAASIEFVDRSADALALASEAAALNGFSDKVRTRVGDAFQTLEALGRERERFDVVVLDPPPFAPSKKDVGPATRGYRKLARLGAAVTARRGFLFIASCSHNMPLETFADAVRRGLQDAGRPFRILATGGAAADHPVHPALPESAYLKSHLLALD